MTRLAYPHLRSLVRRCACLTALPAALLGAGAANAQPAPDRPAVTVGAWSYGTDGGVSGASTLDGAGSRLGIACTGDCINFIETDRPCPEGALLPGTMTSSIGEVRTQFECHRLQARYVLIFEPTADFVNMIAFAPEASFAIGATPDGRSTYRFSLEGAYDAVYATLATAIAATEPPSGGALPPGQQQ